MLVEGNGRNQVIEEQGQRQHSEPPENNFAVVHTDADDAIEALEELGSNPELSRDNDAIMPLFRHLPWDRTVVPRSFEALRLDRHLPTRCGQVPWPGRTANCNGCQSKRGACAW